MDHLHISLCMVQTVNSAFDYNRPFSNMPLYSRLGSQSHPRAKLNCNELNIVNVQLILVRCLDS